MSETLKVVILWERLSTTIYAYFPSIISNASAHFDIEMSPSIDKSNDWNVIDVTGYKVIGKQLLAV